MPEFSLSLPIEEHAAFFYRTIFAHPFPNIPIENDIARFYHGMQHACRVAYYIPVLMNLYRKYGDEEALALANEDIKLLQIAALLHDSARQADGKDFWDKQSGLQVYQYLRSLNVEKEKAKCLAESVANKDAGSNYFKLLANDYEEEYEWVALPNLKKNIFQKLIHDADCLDVKRVRAYFDARELDFYTYIASRDDLALNEMAILILEVKSLLAKQGDNFNHYSFNIKKLYEHERGYDTFRLNLPSEYRILNALYTFDRLLSSDELLNIHFYHDLIFDPSKELDGENLKAAIQTGKIFARSVLAPSCFPKKIRMNVQNATIIHETLADLELYKVMRRKGTPSNTHKKNNKTKQGNPNRSVSLLGFGSGVFGNSGYLIINPKLSNIAGINETNIGSGFGKVKNISSLLIGDQVKKNRLKYLMNHLKMGGSTVKVRNFSSNHVEIIYNVEDYQGIYFSNDENIGNIYVHGYSITKHPNVPILQALFLQNAYELQWGKKLSIFEYSGIHNSIKLVSELDEEKIINLWAEMCGHFIGSSSIFGFEKIIDEDVLDNIKIRSMYGEKFSSSLFGKYGPADSNYSESLKNKINRAICLKIEDQLVSWIDKTREGKLRAPSIIIKLYNKIPYFYKVSNLEWVKSAIQEADILLEILKKINSEEKQSLFLKKLGFNYLSNLIKNETEFDQIASFLFLLDQQSLRDELDKKLHLPLKIKRFDFFDEIRRSKRLNSNQTNEASTKLKNELENCSL